MHAESISDHCSTLDTSDAAQPFRPASSLVSSLALTIGCLLLFCLGAGIPGYAQGSGQDLSGRPVDQEGALYGNGSVMHNYVVQQSIEVGGRITEVTGNGAMFDTLLNEHTGPRVLSQELMVRPMPNIRAPFDDLYLESFGWGGDPSNAARLRVTKRGIYNFNASFRRDKNFFNYDLLANPLVTTTPVDFSPHSMFLTRRMYDFDLVLFPQRTVSFRLGYSRNRDEGPSLSSDHRGAGQPDLLLFQPYSTTENAYRLGASWRVLPRTTFSYNETLQFLKNDTDQNCGSAFPCTSPDSLAPPPVSYLRTQRYRSYLPSEQVSVASSSIPHVDITARYMYSNADGSTPLSEISSTATASTAATGAARSTWVSDEADAGVTVHLNRQLRLVDTFRFYAYRLPGILSLLGTGAVNPAANCSGASNVECIRFFEQNTKSNEFTVQYDITRHLGVHAGYLYRRTFDNHNWWTCPGLVGTPNAFGNCNFNPTNATGSGGPEIAPLTIEQHGAIAGVWYRMSQKFRADAEVRLMSSDNYLARIDPRRQQQYRANITFMPKPWLTATAGVNLIEQRNNTVDATPVGAPLLPPVYYTINYKAHVRNFAFSLVATPNSRISVDVAYDYTSTGQDDNICYNTSGATAPGTVTCDNTAATNPYEALAFYSNHTHYGSANVMFKPVRRVSVAVGYSVINVDGNTLILNVNQPLGPLSYRYDQPLAFLGIDVTKQVQLRAGWNYYQYNENSVGNSLSASVPPTLASPTRYFHANLTTLSLRYAF